MLAVSQQKERQHHASIICIRHQNEKNHQISTCIICILSVSQQTERQHHASIICIHHQKRKKKLGEELNANSNNKHRETSKPELCAGDKPSMYKFPIKCCYCV